MNYCCPVFVRSSGLGNRLFPWARCKIYSYRNAVPMLTPSWAHVRKASLTRGGIDYRNAARKILLWGNFRPARGEVGGWRRLSILLTAERVLEGDSTVTMAKGRSNKLIVFAGDGDHFADLQLEKPLIVQSLREITQSKWLRDVDRYQEVFIGINVRRGKDFLDAPKGKNFFAQGSVRTPLAFYVAALRRVRLVAGREVKALVVSDGNEADLQPLLRESSVELVRSRAAINDLLILARSRVLIGAGGSSFSAWASFLSGAPTVTNPGQSCKWFKLGMEGDQYVGELDLEADPDPEFARCFAKAFSEM